MQTIDWKTREIASTFRMPEDLPLIVRVDGWKFHNLAKKMGLRKPFDERMIKCLVKAAEEPFNLGLPVILAYVFSDEISFLIKPPLPFKGRVEKLVSVFASIVSSSFSMALREMNVEANVGFDGRVVVVRHREISDYLSWRQAEAWRNCINAYAQYALISKGMSSRRATKELKGMKAPELHELVFQELGINLAKIPAWQRRGVLIFIEEYEKEGFDPISNKRTIVKRRRVRKEWEPPLFSSEEGKSFIISLLRFHGLE
ncbi:MAG: tRNA 5'-guanylyltransferase [Thermoproteota archaeon]|nr:MAG: tRNA 5'-guanylyltransferase [Candidatus Korarchaeota archaeon]RLG47767.1 MAG: tRNA 5'-guanylyltransferase [Candidatus Korarchaeota archaeon]